MASRTMPVGFQWTHEEYIFTSSSSFGSIRLFKLTTCSEPTYWLALIIISIGWHLCTQYIWFYSDPLRMNPSTFVANLRRDKKRDGLWPFFHGPPRSAASTLPRCDVRGPNRPINERGTSSRRPQSAACLPAWRMYSLAV